MVESIKTKLFIVSAIFLAMFIITVYFNSHIILGVYNCSGNLKELLNSTIEYKFPEYLKTEQIKVIQPIAGAASFVVKTKLKESEIKKFLLDLNFQDEDIKVFFDQKAMYEEQGNNQYPESIISYNEEAFELMFYDKSFDKLSLSLASAYPQEKNKICFKILTYKTNMETLMFFVKDSQGYSVYFWKELNTEEFKNISSNNKFRKWF